MRCDDGYKFYGSYVNVSIHTPTWGVTLLFVSSLHVYIVSIHTPTWGVTSCVFPHSMAFDVSIHTPTWGVTLFQNFQITVIWFQSTHLHEVWPTWIIALYMSWCFNPHTYMRCDLEMLKSLTKFIMFQSTHLHEVWHCPPCFPQFWQMFQSTHLHEVWHDDNLRLVYEGKVSIHTPTWGVTS